MLSHYINEIDPTTHQGERNNKKREQNINIQWRVDLNKLPSESDYWIAGKNVLINSEKQCDFGQDIRKIKEYFLNNDATASSTIKLTVGTRPTAWTRDCISTKMTNKIFVLNQSVKLSQDFSKEIIANEITDDYVEDIIKYNKNISPCILWNKEIY